MSKWHEALKERRIAYGVAQNQLAAVVGIDKSYLSHIEHGRKIPSDSLKVRLDRGLERFNPDCPLDVLIDYVRIRFPLNDARPIVEKVLQIHFCHMLYVDYGFYGYDEQYCFWDISVMVSAKPELGVLLEIKGQGCRQLEYILEAQGRNWFQFLWGCYGADGDIKRLDLAINDKVGILSVPELTRKCEQGECMTHFRTFRTHHSASLRTSGDKPDRGRTLYLGSPNSDAYFCIYEKDYEQMVKAGTPLDEAQDKNRFEIRLKNNRAYYAMIDLLEYEDVERTAFDIIRYSVEFIDHVDSGGSNDSVMNADWAWFMGQDRKAASLVTRPKKYGMEKQVRWLTQKVLPTLKAVMTADELQGNDFVRKGLRDTPLSDRQRKLLEQIIMPIEYIILSPKELAPKAVQEPPDGDRTSREHEQMDLPGMDG